MTTPRMRASDNDRQHAVERLAESLTDGRLTAAEYDERVGRAYGVVYSDELPTLFVDLPADRTFRDPADPAGSVAGRAFGSGPGCGPNAGPGAGPWWMGAGPRGLRRPPLVLAILALIAVLASVGALAHGFFPIPLIWFGVIFLIARGRCGRRRWAASDTATRRAHW